MTTHHPKFPTHIALWLVGLTNKSCFLQPWRVDNTYTSNNTCKTNDVPGINGFQSLAISYTTTTMITDNMYYSKCSNLTRLMEFYIVRSPNFRICGTATVNIYYILIIISLLLYKCSYYNMYTIS